MGCGTDCAFHLGSIEEVMRGSGRSSRSALSSNRTAESRARKTLTGACISAHSITSGRRQRPSTRHYRYLSVIRVELRAMQFSVS